MNACDPRRSSRTERYGTIVIGAGQAGLAVGYHLSKNDADFLILEAATGVGESWRGRWDSLRLFTPAAFSSLPGMDFPAGPMHLPDKDEVADYLERYALSFDLPVRTASRVTSLGWNDGRYVIDAGAITYEADQVVVATGPFQKPNVPGFSAELAPRIHQVHSSAYRSPFMLPAGPVLVVGAGNSGAQIALEVSRFRRVYLAGASTGHLPRRLLGRDIYQWLWPILTRLTADTRLGRRYRSRRAHDPLVGISEAQLSRAGIERRGRVSGARGGLPAVGEVSMDVDTVIWCTGFAPDFDWIRMPLVLDRGYPRTSRGVVPGTPGLYFAGLRFLHSPTSSLIGGVGDDAAFIARQVVAAEAR